MHKCTRCGLLIKPASLEVDVGGEPFHPQCISCSVCDRLLYGRDYKKTQKGKLQCDPTCQPRQQAPESPVATPRNLEQYRKPAEAANVPPNMQQYNYPPGYPPNYPPNYPPMMQSYNGPPPQPMSGYNGPMPYMQPYNAGPPLPPSMQNYYQPPIQPNMYQPEVFAHNKICKLCNKPVMGQRFVTFENGDTICYDCDAKAKMPVPRVKSAHMVICSYCNKTVQGRRYITEPNGKILCESCEASAPKCTKCGRYIPLDSPFRKLSNGTQYHNECFECSNCRRNIQTNEYYEDKQNNPLCLDCFEETKLPKCITCKKPISGGYFMIDNQPIHKDCFKCNQCNDPISPETGYFKNPVTNLPICQKCNLINNGVKCFKCGRVIEKDGITFSNKDYHQDCFNCNYCNRSLTKMKATYTGKSDDDIMCEPCFQEKYAPKCEKCQQTINPQLPQTQYEGKPYHNSCLICGRCKKTLANKKFFKSGNVLICEACY